MQVAAVLARAHAAVAQGIRYKLGQGGMNPGSSTPGHDGQCDCSGFVAWCLGMSRKTPDQFYVHFNGGWIETTGVWTDIEQSVGIFEESIKRPGAVVVYPDAHGHEGHIGIIVDANSVVHCSHGNDTHFGNAIQITPLTVFNNNPKTRFGWLVGLQDNIGFAGGPAGAGPAAMAAAAAAPNYRSLTPNGFFSSTPNDLTIKRSIRTNNPGALNISNWQKIFPGYAGTTQPDHAGNVTAIYVTPEHGTAAWYNLLTDRYGFGEDGSLVVANLAKKYAGVNSTSHPAVTSYVKGWRKYSGNVLNKDSVIHLSVDSEVLLLARGMFGHEIGDPTPLHDDQILTGVALKRAGELPPN
jgi:hypothetical protein